MSENNTSFSQCTMVKVNVRSNVLAALEPDYKMAYFHLHGGVKNEIPLQRTDTKTPWTQIDNQCEAKKQNNNNNNNNNNNKVSFMTNPRIMEKHTLHSLHTAEELRQPLNQVPPPRSGHLLLSCVPRRSLILHGGLGVGPADLLNDTWEYIIDAQRWVRLNCYGIPTLVEETSTRGEEFIRDDGMPPKAFGQSGTLFSGGRFLFVHGGITNGNRASALSAYQLDIERRLWTRLKLTIPLPDMWGSIAQAVRIPLHAPNGCEKRGSYYNNHNNNNNSNSSSNNNSGGDGGGGGNKGDESSDNSIKTGEKTSVKLSSPSVSTRKESMERIEVVVLFGGMQDDKPFNNTYFLYLTVPPPSSGRTHYKEEDQRIVEELPMIPTSIFPGRRRPCSAIGNDFFLFVFGGRDSSSFYNDLWILNAFTRQWVMVRKETPLRYMREFILSPYDPAPGKRIMEFVKNILEIRRDRLRCKSPTPNPHRCKKHNSSALWRTGAVMVCCGTDIIVHGGFTLIGEGILETHNDVHIYNYMRHVWRTARVDTDSTLLPFPSNYFSTPETISSGLPSENMEEDPLLNTVGSRNWELVRDIPPCIPDGRTMAAMCADPIQTGFRFFLYGGRSEDEPSGDLYDVRISVDYPARYESTWVYADNYCFSENIHITSQPNSIPHPNRIADMDDITTSTTSGTTTPAVMVANSYSSGDDNNIQFLPEYPHFPSRHYTISLLRQQRPCTNTTNNNNTNTTSNTNTNNSNTMTSSSASLCVSHWVRPEHNVRCGRRTLWGQAAEWLQAVLAEEAALRRANALTEYPERGNIVREALLQESHAMDRQLRAKVDRRMPGPLRSVVTHTPPFIWKS